MVNIEEDAGRAYRRGRRENERCNKVLVFSFTTTTLQPPGIDESIGYVIKAAAVTTAVMTRDGTPTTSTYLTATTATIFGEQTSELRRQDYKANDGVNLVMEKRGWIQRSLDTISGATNKIHNS